MSGTSVKIDLLVAGADSEELERLTRQLRAELLQLEVDSVELPQSDQAPRGSKAGGNILLVGTLLLAFSNSNLVGGVAAVLKSWIGRSAERRVRLEIGGDVLEVTELSAELRDRLVEEWLARHTLSNK
jgi:hypothetical protein